MAKVMEGSGMGLMKKWGIHVPNYVVVMSVDELTKLGQANGRANLANRIGPLDTDVAVFFYENSDNFDVVFGLAPGINASGVIGVQRQGWGSNATQYFGQVPYNGLKIHFERPAVICSSGSGTCSGTLSGKRFDFDGDRKADFAVYRPAGGDWWRLNSGTNYATYSVTQFGINTDQIVPADYPGDGKTHPAICRPSAGVWYVLRGEYGSGGFVFLFGNEAVF